MTGLWMARAVLAAAVCAGSPAFAQSPQPPATPPQSNTGPVQPGSIRITTQPPDPKEWVSRPEPANRRVTYQCKPLACADSSRVTITNAQSPTRHPNPQALEKFAKVDLPKQIAAANAARGVLSDGNEKIETLASNVTTFKGYPAVLNETKMSRGSTATYAVSGIIFAGPAMISVESVSPDRTMAMKSLDDFIRLMVIVEGPPRGTPGTAPVGGMQSL
jgi:hypothetical protein